MILFGKRGQYPVTRQGTTLSIKMWTVHIAHGTVLNPCLLIGQIIIDNVGR